MGLNHGECINHKINYYKLLNNHVHDYSQSNLNIMKKNNF